MSQPSRRNRSSNDPKNDRPASEDPDVMANEKKMWSSLELAAVHSFLSRGAPGSAISLLLQIKCQTSYRRSSKTIGRKKIDCDCYNGKTKKWDLPKTDAHIKRLVGQQGLDDLLTPLQLTFEQATELSELGLPESKAKRTGLARFPSDTDWGLSAEHRVNRRKVDLSAALNDFDDSPRAASEESDPFTALTDFDGPQHNPDVAPWQARTTAVVERVSGRRQPSIGPAPQSAYARSPRRHSPDDLTGVTNTMGSAAITAPVRPTIEKGEQSRIPRFDGIDKPTSLLWTRKEDWQLATMYAENREWPEINQAFKHIGPGAAKTRWRTLSIDPEYAWAEPERQRRVDEEKMPAKMLKKRKADEKKEKQAHAQKGDKPSSSGGHKRGKH